jgi:hypothetical protein
MHAIKIKRNNYVCGLDWVFLDGDDTYKRLKSVKKDAVEQGYLLGLGLNPIFEHVTNSSGYGGVLEENTNRKWIGHHSLAATMAIRVPNGVVVLPIDQDSSYFSICLIFRGIPIIDRISSSDAFSNEVDRLIEEYFDGSDKIFEDVQSPRFVYDEAFSRMSDRSDVGLGLEKLKDIAEKEGFKASLESLYGDLGEYKAPASARLRLLKGTEPKTILTAILLIFLWAAASVGYLVYQKNINDSIAKAAAASRSMLTTETVDDTESRIDSALVDLTEDVEKIALNMFLSNTADQYPHNWPIAVVELISKLPVSIGGFGIRSAVCSTTKKLCEILMTNRGGSTSIGDLNDFITSDDRLSDLSLSPSREAASVSITFNEGKINTSTDDFNKLPSFVESFILLSDTIENKIHHYSYIYGDRVTGVFVIPRTEEINPRLEKNIAKLLGSVSTPAAWITYQDLLLTGPNRNTLFTILEITDVPGFGYTDISMDFNEFNTLASWSLNGRLVRRGNAEINNLIR